MTAAVVGYAWVERVVRASDTGRRTCGVDAKPRVVGKGRSSQHPFPLPAVAGADGCEWLRDNTTVRPHSIGAIQHSVHYVQVPCTPWHVCHRHARATTTAAPAPTTHVAATPDDLTDNAADSCPRGKPCNARYSTIIVYLDFGYTPRGAWSQFPSS